MKRTLLTSLGLLAMSAGFAQTTVETALEMKPGDNVFNNEQATERSTAYWKYTATEDQVIVTSAYNSSNLSCLMTADDGTTQAVSGSMYNVVADGKTEVYTVFPAPKGKTVYIGAYGYQQMGFTASMEASPYAGTGYNAENAGEIVPGTKQLFMPGQNWRTDPIYAKYTPEKDGVLKITSYSSSANYAVDESGVQYQFDFDRENYVSNASVKVTGGKENLIKVYAYDPMYFTSEMTYPEPGSYDMPFTVANGANTVPAAAGTYWYVAAADESGMLSITSQDALTGGQVSLYSSTYNISNNRPDAQSAEGSFNLSYAVNAGTTYYIKVVKTETTAADQSFDYVLNAYKDGDTEDRPIYVTDFTQEYTVPSGATVYYAVSLNAGEKKNLTVAATSDVNDAATQVSVYQYAYSAVNGNSSVSTIVDGGYYGSTYKIKWTSKEAGDLTFKVSLDDLAKGDDISNPLDAQLGENTLPSDGTKYYIFKATQSGKLEVTVPEGASVSFPKSEYTYQGSYETVVSGNTYAIDAQEGNDYRMVIDGAKSGGVFTVAYGEWKPGEAITKPLEVEGGEYVLGDETVSNLWLKYTAKNDGILTIDASTVPYDYANNISYCPENNTDNLQMVYTFADGQSLYTTSFGVSAGDTYLVQVKLAQAYSGAAIKFVEREAEKGETVSNPLVLVPGETLSVPEATSNKPAWVKMELQAGDVKFTADGYFTAYLYKGEDNAKNDYMGTYFTMNQTYGGQGSTSTQFEREQTVTDADAGVYYLKVVSSTGFNLSATGDGIYTAISSAHNGSAAVAEGFYSLDGTKLQAPQKGINIVKMSDGRTVKMVINK